MKILVDRSRCSGHAQCHAKFPDLFPIDEEGYSIANGTEVPPGSEENAKLGASYCPERAIAVTDSAD